MYVADFETTTDPLDCRVWAWGLFEIGSYDNFTSGNSIETFVEKLKVLAKTGETIYFHNLKFDGEFLIYNLFKRGFSHVKDKKEKYDASFLTLISDKGQFYAMDIYFKVRNAKRKNRQEKVRLLDSLKVLPFTVEEIAKAFDLPMSKLSIEYDKKREIGYEPSSEEIQYLKNDCVIVARALEYLFNDGLKKMTTAANALYDFRNIIGENAFSRLYPDPSFYDADVRQSYRGGFTYCNPEFQNQEVAGGIVLDVNSLYPYVMYEKFLPYGEPKFFRGEYVKDSLYDVYVQMIRCNFEIKPNHLPTIQIKGSSIFQPTEYLRSSDGEDVAMCLTSVDLKLFFEHYEVYNIEYFGGWKWKSSNIMFRKYIDKWNKEKIEAAMEGNKAKRTLAKLQLNSLYGKFGMNPKTRSKIPYIDSETDSVKYRYGENEDRKPLYIPIASFVTSYAREVTIRAAQSLYDRFLYADTDSLHLLGYNLPRELDIDDVKLGAWKHESSFYRAKYIRAKSYIEEESIIERKGFQVNYATKLKVTCAGMPEKLHNQVTFNNFSVGAEYSGKLKPNHVAGGIVLEETLFTIRK